MTDKKLLELAAKAAGYKPDGQFGRGLLVVTGVGTVDQKAFAFDPLNDDGDALRLAVKLGVSICMNTASDGKGGWMEGIVCMDDCETVYAYEEGRDLAATRRAITRAAAEIGKAMP